MKIGNMTIRDSIQRLGWRFSEASKKSDKSFKINQKDVDAITVISEFYEKTAKENYNSNELAFKMYVWHRVEMMKHYDSDVFDMIPQRVLAEALCKPVDAFLGRLTEYLNGREYKSLATQLPHNDRPHFLLNEIQRHESDKKLRELLKTNPELFKTLTGEVWSKEDVQDNIIAEFNQLLQIVS